MSQQFIVRLGYHDYAVEIGDAVTLLMLMSRLRRVAQIAYSGPYHVLPDQTSLIDTLTLAEVVEPEPVVEPVDRFTAAARALSAEG